MLLYVDISDWCGCPASQLRINEATEILSTFCFRMLAECLLTTQPRLYK